MVDKKTLGNLGSVGVGAIASELGPLQQISQNIITDYISNSAQPHISQSPPDIQRPPLKRSISRPTARKPLANGAGSLTESLRQNPGKDVPWLDPEPPTSRVEWKQQLQIVYTKLLKLTDLTSHRLLYVNPFFLTEEEQDRARRSEETEKTRRGGDELQLARDVFFNPANENHVDIPHVEKARTQSTRLHLYRNAWCDRSTIAKIINKWKTPGNHGDLIADVMEYQTLVQRGTCDAMSLAMFNLYHRVGPELWDSWTVYPRRKMLVQVHKQFPLTIDILLHPLEKYAVDLIGINVVKSAVADTFKEFNECRFVLLAEATMYWRVATFWDCREPVYHIWKTLGLDAAVQNSFGLSMDVGEIPAAPGGNFATNARREHDNQTIRQSDNQLAPKDPYITLPQNHEDADSSSRIHAEVFAPYVHREQSGKEVERSRRVCSVAEVSPPEQSKAELLGKQGNVVRTVWEENQTNEKTIESHKKEIKKLQKTVEEIKRARALAEGEAKAVEASSKASGREIEEAVAAMRSEIQQQQQSAAQEAVHDNDLQWQEQINNLTTKLTEAEAKVWSVDQHNQSLSQQLD
ncbi:Hypothetical predicted protein [Lecanosticta acicola]|uniref:Uncharacterized protein n=1 Tax=Lecanosticta acicola TaxID=111012 RepID=A0AAI8YTZ7_9PEZI|nr:Hypothetical predicted protein [Lecanosticta acicola]